MTHFNTINLEYTEIYPKIFVYHNLFPDHENLHSIMQDSEESSLDESFFSKWTDWFVFGRYCHSRFVDSAINNIIKTVSLKSDYDSQTIVNEAVLSMRINQGITSAVSHYIALNNVKLPEDSYITDQNIARYEAGVDVASGLEKSMNYHTDYGIGEWYWPGEKFLITATTYMNDNYDGGEIVFLVKDKVIPYKPKAGEIVVFPSGSPLYPGGEPYFHSVNTIKNGNKFLVRMYIKHSVERGHQKWYDGQNKYGEKEWLEIAKKKSDGHNLVSIDVKSGEKRYSGLLTKLYNIPYDNYVMEKGLHYDDDDLEII